MTFRFASALFALALPLAAQNPTPAPAPAPVPSPAAAEADNLFYKGFYLHQKNDLAGAMDLFQKFLDAAPDSKHAPEAAGMQVAMLDKTGKSKERDAFKAKYEKQLAAAPKMPPPGDRPAGDNERQPGAGGQPGGRGQGRAGMAGYQVLYGDKKVADMTAEEKGQVKEALGMSARQVDRLKQNGEEEKAKKIETAVESLKKALDENKTEDAQKALDTLRAEGRPARGRGQGGGGQGGGGQGGGQGGGGQGNGGGTGGTGNGGGNKGGGDR